MKNALAALGFLGPFVLTAWHGVTEPSWRSDAATRAVLGGDALLQGAPSAELARLFQWLPLGSHVGRAGLVSAFAAGAAGLCLFWLTRDLLLRQGGSSKFDPWLALAATFWSTLSATWLGEGVLVGGAAPGAALALGLLCSVRRHGASSASWIVHGLWLGTLAAESGWLAAGVLVALSFEPTAKPSRHLAFGGLAALGVLALWLLPLWKDTSPVSPVGSWLLGELFPYSVGVLLERVGLVAGLAAIFGVATGWGRPRAGLAGPLCLVFFDLVAPARATGELFALEAEASRSALHLVALGLWAACGALGLRAAIEGAAALRLYGARAAGVLTTVFAVAAALAGAEDAARALGRASFVGARDFTDEAWSALPPRALVLVHSDVLTSRLLTAQSTSERPDVLLVPLGKLGEVKWMKALLALEPRLERLVRDLNVQGAPSEHALNLLADERAVFVEADPSWDRRLLEHVLPLPLLAGFSPHALGRSDRLQAWNGSRASLARVQASLAEGAPPDRATRAVLDGQLERLEAALTKAGDKKMAELVHATRAPTPAGAEERDTRPPSSEKRASLGL